jgi:predicted metal-dependent phosphoesterase TrpH
VLNAFCSGQQVGRPHFAQYLVEIGAVSNFQQAFKRYLGAGKAGDIKQQWASLGEVINWIRGAGGRCSISSSDQVQDD